MKRIVSMFCAVVLLLAMAGCVPDRVVWSPDGSRAAVLGDDGLHLCDADGKIGPMLAAKVVAVEWMPDGKGFVAEEETELKSWNEIAAAFSDDVRQVVDSKRMDAVRKALVSFDGDWSNLVGALMQKTGLNDQEVRWNMMSLRDRDAGVLQGQMGEHWGAVKEMTFTAEMVRVYHLEGAMATAGPVVTYLNHAGLHSLRLSPNGRAVAVTWTANESSDRAILGVFSTDGSNREFEIGLAAMYPDWSPDGKYLVYIRPTMSLEKGTSQAQFGTLSRRQVWDKDGKLLEGQGVPPAEDLAGLLFDTLLRVRVAKDGRIFFISAEVSLPVTAADFDPKPELFCVDPGRQATVERVVPRSERGNVGDALQFFEVSPDGGCISVPFQDGRVSVIHLAEGSVEIVQGTAFGGDDKMKLSSVPTWRSANELTFVRPAGEGAEVVRYSIADKSAVVMSKEWPEKVAGEWLSRKKAATQAAKP